MRKRIMWFAILLLAICNKIAAEDRVYVSDFSISPGETREINVMLDNEDAYVGFQFDVYLPDGFTITSCSKSDRIPDGTTVLGNQRTDDTGSFYRVIGASLMGNAITGTSGAIATLTITADASVALNDYTGYLRNIKVSKASGTGLTKDQETFTITVKSPEPYAALSSDNKTLTFYYDSQKQTRSGMSIGPFASGSNISWYSQRTSITTVVFDASFANYTNLTSTAYWFIGCHNLTTITGIANLKTDNVTSMVSMFSNCVNLHWVDVSGFNTSNVTDMSNMFMNCSKLEYVDVTHFNTAKVNNMSGMFYGCTDLSGLDVSGFDTGNVTTMKEMFRDCSSLSTLDISNFNTAKVTTMLGMFLGCSHLRALEFGNNFVTSKVQSMSMMFAGCKYLETLDLSNFDTSNVLGMYNMFESCWGLTSLDLSTFNTANLLDMSAMFYDCANLNSINLSSFNTAKVTNMAAMFYECPDLIKLDLKNFNTAKVKEMARMFYNCTSLTTIDVGSEWSTASVTDSGENMFSGCSNLKGGSGTTYAESHIDKEYARIDEGTANPGYLSGPIPEPYAVLTDNDDDVTTDDSTVKGKTLTFYYDTKKEERGGMSVGPFDINSGASWKSERDKITTVVFDDTFADCTSLTSTAQWFSLCSKLKTITGIANLKTDNVTNMFGMFSGCSSLTEVDVSGFNTDNVTNMFGMFTDCSGLTSLNVSRFNTENVTIMDDMFSGCSSLKELDVSGFNTENVTIMRFMFYGCSGLTSLDVSRFDTKNVTSMTSMFQGCSGLTSLDMSGFNTANVAYMTFMFADCSGLMNLDVSGFNTTNAKNMGGMFWGCSGLSSLDVSRFNTDNVTDMSQMFYGCSSLTSLDLSSFNTSKLKYDEYDGTYEMGTMFSGCSALTTIYVGEGWNVENLTMSTNVFKDCTALVGGAGTHYDPNHTDTEYARIDGGTDNPGYFTRSGDEPYKEKEPYAVLTYNEDGIIIKGDTVNTKTLTFYYDTKKEERNGMSVGPFDNYLQRGWINDTTLITTVVFDTSFANCTTLTSTAFWFEHFSNLASLRGLANFKTNNVTDMHCMFYGCRKITDLDLGNQNTANVTNMASMFAGCSSLKNVNLLLFNTENVTDMNAMFYKCSSLTDLNMSSFNTEKVTNMQHMFFGCTGLTSLAVTLFNTANVTSMLSMFYGCSGLTSIDLSSFKTDKVTDMRAMFFNCSSLTTIYAGNKWNTEALTADSVMFSGCTNLVGSAGTVYDANHIDAKYAHIDGGTDNPGYFSEKGPEPYASLSDNNTVLTFYYDGQKMDREGMSVGPFSGYSDRGWYEQRENITKVVFDDSFAQYTELTSTFSWFDQGKNIVSIEGLSNLNTDSVVNMRSMFEACSSLTTLDLSHFNTAKVKDFGNMFAGCSNLTTIYVGEGWSTEAVTEESTYMFAECTKLVGGVGTVYDADHVDKVYAHIDGGTSNPGYFTDKNKKNVTITAKSCSREYGEANPTFEYTVEGATLSGEPTITCEATATSPVGTYPIVITYTAEDASKMNLTYVNGTLTITKAPLTITAKSYTIKRGSALPTFEVEYSGFKNNETDTVLTKKAVATCEAKADTVAGTYQIVVSGAEAANYEMEYVNGTLTITDDVVVTAKSYTREYGDTNPTFEYTVDGAKLEGTPAITCEATATSPVGTYDIIIAKGNITNKDVTFVNGTLTITKAKLKATAKSYTIKRGSALPTFEVEYSGFKNNETDTVFTKKAVATCEAKADTVVGTYQIVVSGAEAANYEMEYVNGTLTITDDVVVTAKSYTREYGDANPTFEYTVDGAKLEGTPAITCEATATSPVGTYDIIIAKGDITNTDVTYVNGTLTITKAKLKVAAKSYTIKRGSALPTFEVEYSGFKNNETDTIFTKKAVAICEAKADTVAGTYQIVVSGAEAANYEMEYVNGTLTITDDVVVTAKSYTREYGDANPTFEYTVDGAKLEGTPAITCEATATSPVGTYDIIIAKGNITNKDVTFVKGTLTITKAPLTITAKSYTVKQGKDLPALKLEYSGFKNNETDTVFTTKPTVTTKATKNSALGTYEITVSGAEANNYEIKHVNATLTITEKAESFDGIVLTVDKGGDMDDAFEDYGGRVEAAKTIAAIIWNNNVPLTDAMLNGISNPNLLVYVSEASMAPKDVKNLVVNGKATNIVLVDADGNNNFFVPQEFTTENISYSRIFKQTTQDGISRGWEGICLPFDVQKFIHEEHGEISPFANSTCDYHFWLRQPTDDGVINALSIEANKPYIISMPNSDEYDPEFNHPGLLRFISSNVTIPATKVDSVWLGDSAQIAPTFLNIEAAPDIYVLNVGDSIMNHREGSIFISNYRSARPFEVYTIHEPRANETNTFGSRIISLSSLFGGNGTTGIIDAMKTTEPSGERWYDMNGRRLQSKPTRRGIYIRNGKKVVIK